MTRRYVIIGNGPSGRAAAESVRGHDPAGEITIVGDEPVPFYSRPGLAYLLTGTIPEKALFARPRDDDDRLGVRRVTGTVTRIEPGRHRVVVDDAADLTYDRLLLAVGARALRPPVPGIDLDGVVSLDSLADARRIIRLARRAKRACVVGGGITAIELAEGLAARRVETHYVMRGERYWGSVLDPEESVLVERLLADEGVRIHRGDEVASVIGERGRVVGVTTRSGATIECQVLAVAIGIEPRVELARQAGLTTGRGILTDATFMTSDPDVYAAGDVAEVLDPETGRRQLDSLWTIATEQGRIAGKNLAGIHQPYRRRAPMNVTRIGGITTTLIGSVGSGGRDDDLVMLSRGASEAWRERLDAFAVVSGAGVDHLRLLLGDDRIVGAVVMGNQALSRPLQHLIHDRVDIRPVRDRLANSPLEVPGILATLAEGTVAVGAL